MKYQPTKTQSNCNSGIIVRSKANGGVVVAFTMQTLSYYKKTSFRNRSLIFFLNFYVSILLGLELSLAQLLLPTYFRNQIAWLFGCRPLAAAQPQKPIFLLFFFSRLLPKTCYYHRFASSLLSISIAQHQHYLASSWLSISIAQHQYCSELALLSIM